MDRGPGEVLAGCVTGWGPPGPRFYHFHKHGIMAKKNAEIDRLRAELVRMKDDRDEAREEAHVQEARAERLEWLMEEIRSVTRRWDGTDVDTCTPDEIVLCEVHEIAHRDSGGAECQDLPNWLRGEMDVIAAIGASTPDDHPWVVFARSLLNRLAALRKVGSDGPDGVALIAAERRRQAEAEGWTAEHDDEEDAALSLAAALYAIPSDWRGLNLSVRGFHGQVDLFAALWPWAAEWWRPTPDDRIRELVKAGALIAAEIDRLQRAASRLHTAGV